MLLREGMSKVAKLVKRVSISGKTVKTGQFDRRLLDVLDSFDGFDTKVSKNTRFDTQSHEPTVLRGLRNHEFRVF